MHVCLSADRLFLTLYWGKNAVMIEFTRRHIIKEIKVNNY